MRRRPFGVYLVVSGLVCAAVSFGLYGLFSLGLLILIHQQGSALPGAAPLATKLGFNVFMIAVSACFGFLCAWAAATASGMWRLRRWALISARVQAVGLACAGMICLIITLLAFQARHEHYPARTASAHALNLGIVIFAAFTAILLALSVGLIVYLARKTVRQLFAAPPSAMELAEDAVRSPLSLFLVAVLLLLSTCSYLGLAFTSVPALLFAFNIGGLGARLFYCTCAALFACLAWGLFRYQRWARLGTIGFLLFFLFNGFVVLLLPSKAGFAAYSRAVTAAHVASSFLTIPPMLPWAMLLATALLDGAIFYALQRHRQLFARTDLPSYD